MKYLILIIFPSMIIFLILIGQRNLFMNNIQDYKSSSSNRSFRLYTPDVSIINNLEPLSITYSDEYNFIRSMALRLFEIEQDGEIVPSLAKNFQWKNNTLKLSIKNTYTSENNLITIKDVYYSIMRAMIINKGSHGKIKELLCPNNSISSFNDKCSTMWTDEDKYIFFKTDSKLKNRLIQMLASIELSIIPFNNIDKTTYQILNWNNTTGFYYVAGQIQETKNSTSVILKYNEHNNILLQSKCAKEIELIALKGISAKDAFDQNIVDIVPTFASSQSFSVYKNISENLFSNVRYFSTLPIHLRFLQFSNYGITNTTSKRRIILGIILKDIITKFYQKEIQDLYYDATEITPQMSNISLTNDLKIDLNNIMHEITTNDLVHENGEHITFAIYKNTSIELLKQIQTRLPMINIVQNNVIEMDGKMSAEKIHCRLSAIDSFYESTYHAINYLVEARLLNPNIDNAKKWLENFLNITDSDSQKSMLIEAHYNMLKEGYVFPLYYMPYIAVAKRPWIFKMSGSFAGTPLWLIEHE